MYGYYQSNSSGVMLLYMKDRNFCWEFTGQVYGPFSSRAEAESWSELPEFKCPKGFKYEFKNLIDPNLK